MSANIQIAEGYEHIYGGYRTRANVKVGNGTYKISTTIKGWLDENLEPTSRKKATYIHLRRWSYGDGDDLPQYFAIVCPPVDPVWPWR
jgi:hypothetical protein